MLRKPTPQQTVLEMVTLESLVPPDHLLRKIDAVVDFSFIHDRVAGLYCADNGRPALDPVVMFKALFIGYLFGVRSERQLVREITVSAERAQNLALKAQTIHQKANPAENRRGLSAVWGGRTAALCVGPHWRPKLIASGRSCRNAC